MHRKIRYLVISDIHLGHKRNKTIEIINNLDTYFTHYTAQSQFSDLDIIFLAGDVFDQLLDLSSMDIHEISMWFCRLMGFCARFNIKLRVLEGTPSHDWKQSKLSETIHDVLATKADFRYIDTLHIEFIKDLDMHVLYVPDEWTGSTATTFAQVKVLLRELNIEQVDVSIMHGMFKYQLGKIPSSAPTHVEDDYLAITRGFINIGHVHTFSSFERIVAEGSFDRLAHGEEEAKGGVLCTLDPDNGNQFAFIENKGAKQFKTIELKNMDLDKSMEKIAKVMGKLRENSYVRIKASKDHPVYIGFDELKFLYPMFYFSKKNIEDDKDDYLIINTAAVLEMEYTPITITEDNVCTLLLTEIKTKYDLTERKLSLLTNILKATHV